MGLFSQGTSDGIVLGTHFSPGLDDKLLQGKEL